VLLPQHTKSSKQKKAPDPSYLKTLNILCDTANLKQNFGTPTAETNQ
jgi:hypothetical protein